jgi:hypothetical protein
MNKQENSQYRASWPGGSDTSQVRLSTKDSTAGSPQKAI